jgi:PleD family two-component response regulator
MPTLNQSELDHLERRESHLTILAAVVVLILAAGVALLMYPLVFVHGEEVTKWPMRFAFFGFCVLSLLVAAYLLDRQRTFRSVKQQLVAELQRNIDLRHQADADLLHTIPDLNHFQDRLAMDYRRASAMEHALSVLAVKIGVSPSVTDSNEATALVGEIARAIGRNLRPSDSMYLLATGFFGVVLSDTDTATAKKLTAKLQPAIRQVAGEEKFTFEMFVRTYPDNAKSAHELEQAVASRLPSEQTWDEVPTPTA